MSYVGYITTLKNVRKHPNADRLQLGDCFGNTVCVSLDYYEGQVGLYLPTDGQVSTEFAQNNNLLRLRDENGHSIAGGGYMDPKKRNVSAIRLRGEKSDGLFLPIKCLDYCFEDGNAADHLSVGDTIDMVNGHEICKKYIPPLPPEKIGKSRNGNRTRKRKVVIAPQFAEHVDTEQLAYNLDAFKPGDEIEITLKMHGTSQRTGYLPTLSGYSGPMIARWIAKKDRKWISNKLYNWTWKNIKPVYGKYGYVTGTRRTVLSDYEGGYYGSDKFREGHAKTFEGKLWTGESVYYEVVGFTENGVPIMGDCSNRKLNDKEFVKKYGETTRFSYGCEPDGVNAPQNDIYVYRMTMTTPDGNVIEYTPDFMRYRCEQMGVKTVPVFWKGTIPYTEDDLDSATPGARIMMKDGENAGEWIKSIAEQYYDGPDPIGKTHIREGVVVRIINRPKFAAYKHKNFSFKVLENIIKLEAEAPDMEEADGLEVEV